MKDIYLRFIALANAIEGKSEALPAIDATAKQLLNVIAVCRVPCARPINDGDGRYVVELNRKPSHPPSQVR
jgi:hypothetical protein